MDGRRHETSLRLIAASIPAQALMMAGVAALMLGAASHPQPAPAIQVGPAQVIKPAPVYVDPVEACWAKVDDSGVVRLAGCTWIRSRSAG